MGYILKIIIFLIKNIYIIIYLFYILYFPIIIYGIQHFKYFISFQILRIQRAKRTISTGRGLGCYKWYQSQTPSGVSARTLGSQGGWSVRPIETRTKHFL